MDTAELANITTSITACIVTVANVGLVILTSIYVYLTRAMVLEMRSSRDPSVFIDIEFPDMEGRFVIGNSGQSAAREIKFRMQDNIPWVGEEKRSIGLHSIEAITDGISYLPPNRTLKYYVGIPNWKKIKGQNCLLEMQVEYKDEGGKRKFEREYIIDFSQYQSVLFESFRDSNWEVAQAIRNAERSRKSQTRRSSPFIDMMGKKPCPMCAEQIPIAAKKCSHCGELLTSDNGEAENNVWK